MKALITGGAGFIGSHLAEELLAQSNSVTVIDDFSTGSLNNIKHLKGRAKFAFCLGSILKDSWIKKLIKDCDIVYHLAAAVGVKYIIDNPLKSLETNVHGTELILKYAHEFGNKKVILASTSEIYGKNRPGSKAFKETDDRLQGSTTISRWGYACSKALDEFMGFAYYREKKLPIVVVRYFNTCGPRQTGRYGMVIPRFVKQSLLDHDINIYGTGKQTRCFCHVKDTVKATIRLASNKRAQGEAFNVGNPQPVSIEELAKKIKKMTSSNSRIACIPYEKAYEKGFEDMMHRKPDISKLVKYTGFTPSINLTELLRDTIKFYKK